jgi:GNAT superfamily N-acetyltransferase
MAHLDRVVLALAERQHGHITRRQALDAGLTDAKIRTHLAAGRWERVHKGVFRIAGAPRTWEGRAFAAVLACGPSALVSHACAAHLWELEGFGPKGIIDVLAPYHARSSGHRGVRVHESKAFHLRDEVRRKGVPCTGVARTILDVCAVVDDDLDALDALGALDSALLRRIVTWNELWRCLILHAARGRTGVARFRRILVQRHGKRVPHMKIARMTLELIVDAGLREPVSEHPVGKYRIDLAYPELKIAIECLGKEGHLNDASFEYDPIRRNELQLEGWIVIEVTWRRLIDEPHHVVREVRRAIALRTGA